MNIRRQLIWIIVTAALIAAVTVSFAAWREYVALRAGAEKTALRVVYAVGLNYTKDLRRLRLWGAHLATMPAVYKGPPGHCTAILARVVDLNPLVVGIAVIGPHDHERCGAGSLAQIVGAASLPLLRREQNAFPSRLLNVPLPGGGRLFVAGRPGRSAWQDVQDLLPRGSSFIVVGPKGHVRARWPNVPLVVGKLLPSSLAAIWIPRPALGLHPLIAIGVDGVRRLYVNDALRLDTGSVANLIVGIPEAHLLASARDILFETLGLGLAIVVVLLAVFVLVGHFLVGRPVWELLDCIERFSSGDETARSALGTRRDEFGALARGFNRLAERVNHSHQVFSEQLEQTERLNRAYHMLSGINQALLRMRDQASFLQLACRIAVKQGGLRMAWIGEVEPATGQVRVVGQAGPGREMIEGLSISTDGTLPEGRGTVGPALRSGLPQVVQNIATDPRMEPWREALLNLGCGATLTFPLIYGEQVFGNLTVYATTTNTFDEALLDVYHELAGDIAFGIHFLLIEGQRDWLLDHDAATNLANYHRFFQWFTDVTTTLTAGENLVVGVLQVDQLAELRTRHGREAVDTLRRVVGARLAERLDADDLLAVLSEDDFLIAWHLQPEQDITVSALDLLSVSPLELSVAGEPVRLTMRLGIEPLSPELDVKTLIRHATLAVGSLTSVDDRRLAFYSARLETQEKYRFELLRALERANFDEEMRLVYQPHIDLTNGRVLGAEALLRWRSPILGEVLPGEFIPAAEQSGQIRRISQWVLGTTFAQLNAWQLAQVEPGVISINLSAQDCADTKLVDLIRVQLDQSGLDPHRTGIAVELTETDAVTDLKNTAGILKALKTLGFLLYLDDFGTGFATMSHLVDLPLDAIKIDLSFVQTMLEKSAAHSVTEASIALGHGLGLQLIAEGVETEAQLEALRTLGCDAAQGYFISKPLEVAAFEAWLLNRRAKATTNA